MPQEILSVAIYEALPGQEEASLATMGELLSALAAGGYSRDRLYRDGESHYILVRYWKSEEARRQALEDPQVLRCWARLSHEIEIVKVYERLEEVEL
jgi:heme-degrading monooxygenase HmoA